jgi:hypothetical protein
MCAGSQNRTRIVCREITLHSHRGGKASGVSAFRTRYPKAKA